MTQPRKHPRRTRALTRSLAAAAVLVTLAPPGSALALSNTVPTFPVPASARVQPTTGGTAGAPTGTVVAPTTTATGAPTSTATAPQTTAPPTGATPTVTAATPSPPVTPIPVGVAQPTAAKPTSGSSGPSTPAILAAVVAALLALGCALWAVARLQAFEPHWTLSLRHTLAEAGFRASATWAEFSDWARLGR
jgi:hypothetical protein